MDDKKNADLKAQTTISRGFAPPKHEESNCDSQPMAENSYKKNVTIDTDCGRTIDASSAQDKQDATKVASTSIDDADFSLLIESSDEDTLNDTIDTEGPTKVTKIDDKSAISNKSETLFSDIESSDDSNVYEPKNKSAVSVAGGQSEQKGSPTTATTECLGEVKKVIESEFDLVESDEEFFEDLPLPEKTEPISDATISSKTMEEEEERSSTPLIDEENDSSTEIDLKSEAVNANLELASQSTIITSDHSMDLMLESSVEMPELTVQDSMDTSNSDNVIKTTEITTSQVLADDKSEQVEVDKKTSIGPNLIPEVLEEDIILSTSSVLLQENEECPTSKFDSLETDMVISESSKQAEEKSRNTTSSPDKKLDKLLEDLPNVDSESSETSQKIKEIAHDPDNILMSPTISEDEPETTVEISKEEEIKSSENSKKILGPENISMSPTLLEGENISQSVQPETEIMETDVELTEELNPAGDVEMEEDKSTLEVSDSFALEIEKPKVEKPAMQINETIFKVSDVAKMEEDQSIVEVNESFASENDKKPVVEESTMQIDETILGVSEVSEMETNEDDITDQNESQKSAENEEHVEAVEAVKTVETKKSDEAHENNKEISNVVENILDIDKPIEKSTQSSKVDDKLCDLDQSEQIQIKSDENAPVNDLLATEEIKELPIIEPAETKSVDSSKLSAHNETKEGETTEKENLEQVIEKTDAEEELLEKPSDVGKSQTENSDVAEKLSETTSSSLDDHKTNKEVIPLENIEKAMEDQMKCDTERVQIQNTVSHDTSIMVIEKTSEKTIELIPEPNENKLSSKEIAEPAEKSDCVTEAPEKIESPQKIVVISQESNKKPIDSTKTQESCKEIQESVEESKEKEESAQAKTEETSEETSKQTNQETATNDGSTVENVEIINEAGEVEGDSMKTSESLTELEKTLDKSKKQENDKEETPVVIVDEIEKPAEPTTDSFETQKSLKEIVVSQETNSIEKAPSKEVVVSQERDSMEKPESPKETVVSQGTESIEKQDTPKDVLQKPGDSKKSEEGETIKSTKVTSLETAIKTLETPEVATEVVLQKVVEAATPIESTKPNPITETNSGAAQDAKKPAARVDPNIIEIDDDDDDEIVEEKKLEDNSKKDENTSSEKELQDKKIDDVKQISQNKENNDLVTSMDVDKELTARKPAQKLAEEDQTTTNRDAKTDQESAVKDDNTTMKEIPVGVLDDDEEPLLVIDTSHKEDNDTESNCMDNETATSAPTTDSSSDGSLEVFYDKECVNYECKRASKNFYRATVFAMNYFKVSKKRTKTQFVCEDCYDRSLTSYEELCKTLKLKQPLLHGTTFKCQEFVEIIDSSDEDESDTTGADKVKVSDENALPKESIEMLEAELEGAIRKVMHSVDIQNQLSWTKQILQQRLSNLQEDSEFVTEQLRALQRKADHMHNSLYQCPKIKLRQLTPLDLNSGRMYNPESDNSTSIPLPGDIIRNPICINEQYYAVKTKAIASWVPCKVIEEVEGYPTGYNQTKTFKIKFTKLAKYPMFKTVYAKHMAYYDPPNVRLPIGSRVIAYFDATSLSRGKEKMLIPSAFYPGIIAEPLKQSNKFRYLVFYDDGYFQYVNHKDVRLVCQASENVWEDVHHQSREFIHNYLTQYAVNRPMVQTQKGQSMLVDYNGKWIYARVIDVDCSLVQMLFEGQSRSEWIYRGSTRLGPVYKESNNLSQKNTLNATRRRTEPFIRYINGDDSSSSQQVQEAEQQPSAKSGSSEIRSVAKKSVSRVDTSNNNSTVSSPSTAQPVPTVRHLNNSTIFVDDDNKPKGKVVYYTARKNLPPRNYVPHICNPSCPFNITHNLSFYSPLAKPLLSGWERQVFRQKSKKFIIYRGPCGKRMRNIEELHRYLRVTDNELNVDNFDFSPDTNCLAEYVLEKCLVNKKDISCGKEKMPIPCVNYYDETMPPACEYSAERIPTEGVPLNLDEEFMCGCDCEDDCSDKTKCACWQLTYAGAKYGMPTVPTDMVGYQYKRLYEHVPTGIYECNSRCKCKSSCVNRVVQQPLQSKLQVFKTSNRGWGLRCINDVPRGSFICVYAGQMLTEQVANEGGLDAGDEYFAELDYIEVAEQIKEGYESDVQEPEEDEDIYNPEREDDDMDFRAPGESTNDKEFTTRLRARKGNKNSTDGEFDSQERQVISFEPNKNMDTSNEPNEKPTIRKLFGKDESCYVMDAKVRGNLGRYFNHSCSPNLFVQNVFVDTHDLRFPWVAFFASTHIRAGTELTWNYNYEVGVVPGKVLYCQCGAPNCRQRLL